MTVPTSIRTRQTARGLILLLITALTLAACLPASPSPTPTPTPGLPTATKASVSTSTIIPATLSPSPSLNVEAASLRGINLQVWHAFVGPAYDLFTAQAAQFSASNEWGITVTPVGYGDYTTLFDVVDTAIQSGGTPGLVVALPEQTLAWDTAGRVVDLTPYVNDPAWGLAGDTIADIPAVFWNQDNVNGRRLGVPAERSARFLFYNKTWAHKLGFDHPPETADEFRQQACAANAALRRDQDITNDGKGGWIVDSQWQSAYSWFLAFGGGVLDGTDYRFRSDPNLAALQFLKKMYDDYCAWPGETPYKQFALREALFIGGDLAEVPLVAAALSAQGSTDEWTLIPFPGPQTGALVAYGPSYTVLTSTPEGQLAAWLFARWLLSPESQAQWVETTNLLPLRNSVLGLIQSYRSVSPQWEAAVASLALAQGVPQLASWRKVRSLLEDGMTVIFPEDTPADRIPDVLAEMDSMAEELK